ncbi:FtsW/RodA/SpoVE family cell cycle protein, partial [bacterium]|nr:FtsW/RodA/SpoVE family cell cycle protein [bacterium]
ITLLFGQEVNGARRWMSFLGVQLQPSEIAKLTVIIVTAHIFYVERKFTEWFKLVASLLVVLPIVLLIYLEPHGSMAAITLILWFVTVFLSMKDQLRNILLMLIMFLVFAGLFALTAFAQPAYLVVTLVGFIVAIFVYNTRENWQIPVIVAVVISIILGGVGSILWNNVLSDYQKQRIVAFQNPEANANSAFNVEQSKIAIGSGGIWGKGFANGTQSRLQFLPFHQTDFIFATYAEEFGLVGSILLLIGYFALFWAIFSIALQFPIHDFATVVLVAVGLKILLELFINLGTNLGITPATGIPLPLMSAGGTITIVTFFSLGLIQSIIANIKNSQMYKPKS